MFSDIIILAGGSGERLWPASAAGTPKQFLSVDNEKSLFQSALERACYLDMTGSIVIVTHRDFTSRIAQECRELLDRFDKKLRRKMREKLFILPEPAARNTASAVMLSCIWLLSRGSSSRRGISRRAQDSTVLVMPCDHIIGDTPLFTEDISIAARIASEREGLVFLGIPPGESSVSFGYIQSGAEISSSAVQPYPLGKIFSVQSFREKPDRETARKYFETGEYFWNSGMVGFRAGYLMDTMRSCAPTVYDPLSALWETVPSADTGDDQGIRTITNWDGLGEAYGTVPSISISRAVAEKEGAGYVVIAEFPWADAGNWETFSRFCHENPQKVTEIDSSNCCVWSDIPVALCGVEDLIVVIKNGHALVLKKGHGDKVKELQRNINERNRVF